MKMNLKLNQKLLVLCLMLTIPALFVANQEKENASPQKYIRSLELAQKIKDRESIRLIDLRSEKEYNEFHLPGAENKSKQDFLLYGIVQEGRIIFYSGEDHDAVNLWEELPVHIKVKSRILYGGVSDWYERLLYPKLPVHVSDDDKILVDKIKELSRFYGGQPEFVNDPQVLHYYRKSLHDELSENPVTVHKNFKRRGC